MHVDEGDYDAAVARLREHGLEVHEEDFGDTKALYVTDPDGNVVELWDLAGRRLVERDEAAHPNL